MSNLSDFLGGSGGGGDPQANFQASANVANGDLVVLNDNGTVEPVTSTAVAADFTQSDNGTKLYAGGIRQTSSYGVSLLIFGGFSLYGPAHVYGSCTISLHKV